MASARHEKLEQIFHSALELDSQAQRAAFLEASCGDDTELRGHVEGLLNVHGRAGSFLETPPLDLDETLIATASDAPAAATGAKIGRYKILQEIGAGGFGVVYLAEQEEPVHRKVALKIIKLGMDTREVIARFEAERQALALMDHPNIARVFDAGATETGRPYFVMELVRGVRITQYCDDQRLTVPERLKLLLSVCHAVQHAHQKGIIHRDLKPGNVLVTLQDGRPVPKVIDFGIAKATSQRLTDKTLFTERHQFLGTPEYMSPDQVGGGLDIDTRTDVYSLGVLLYELLTGATPFDRAVLRKAPYDEIRRIVREVEPPRPSARVQELLRSDATIAARRRCEPAALTKLIRGDLDSIVMKAMEKDRTHRYATAKDLADDVERHLRHEPVVAGPPGATYRLRKFVRRHYVGTLASAVVVLALLGGLSMATVGLIQVSRARGELEAERDAAQQARAREQEHRALAEASADEARRQAARSATVNEFLQEMLRSADPSQALGREVTMRYALDEAAHRIHEGALADQPEVEAAVRTTLGETYAALGLYTAAEAHLRAAQEMHSRLFGPEHRDTLRSNRALAALLRAKGKCTEAEMFLRQTAEVQRRVLGPEHADTLATLHELGLALQGAGRLAEAEAVHRQTLDVQRRTLGEEHAATLESLAHLGAVCYARGQIEEAEAVLRRALEMSERVLGEQHPCTGLVLNNLGRVMENQEQYEQAEGLYRRAYDVDRQVLGPDHPHALIPMNDLVRVLQRQGKTAETRPLVIERLARLKRAAERPDADALALRACAWELLHCEPAELRDPQAALPLAARAVELDGGREVEPLETLALAYRTNGRLDEAVETQRRAVARAQMIAPQDRAAAEARLVDYLVEKGDVFEAARVSWGDMATRMRGVLVPGTAQDESLILQSEAAGREGRWDEAESLLRGCLAMREKALPARDWQIADTLSRLGATLAAQGMFAEAESLLLEGFAQLSEDVRTPAGTRRQAIQRLVDLYAAWDKPGQAKEWRQRLTASDDARGQAEP